ncbi:superoxide dismutase [Methylobacterium sp. Leaf399]|uniref:superoxide dismutase family protein n=1 Tax=Methylobacterium sp. Leaf399 TaxID=1736364 RepID=UPI0006FEF44D|nr:superoxide dismutase [Methylobacterium sp. Leaf108]KQT15178.1 superoxide dismutase [Methylobacterium sp. Leaf399]KQT83023.1 superoxide dismutase [Methylobacterium sp. Leaf466]
MTHAMPTVVRGALGAAFAAGLVAMPALAQTPPPAIPTVESDVVDGKGEAIGRIVIRDGANALVLRLTIRPGGLPPGWHGLHFHAVGDCSDPEGFAKSKAHVNHDQSKHGLLNTDGPDEGDLPNVHAAADGSVNAEVSSDTPLTGEGGLKDGDGSALVIHANEDDHTTQPIGGAGARIACAVIK